MTIRQNYIDNFKTYCKIQGYPKQENNTQYLFDCIKSTLKNLGYHENISLSQTYPLANQNFTYIKPGNPIITGIYQIKTTSPNDVIANWSWTINQSNKLHNNSTMICYIMKKLINYT